MSQGERSEQPRVPVFPVAKSHLATSPSRQRANATIDLAQAVWDLFNSLVEVSSTLDERHVLGDWWDEHKHKLEAILRTKGDR